MSAWSRKRRFLYGSTVAAIIVIASVFVGWKFFYKAPSCFDGIKNGTETGIDCGGSCQKLCASAFLPAQAQWTKFEKIGTGLYNVAAYIVNPNPDGQARRVPYKMSIFDDTGLLVTEYKDFVTLPPHRNTLVFKGALNLGSRLPSKAVFEFTAVPDWEKASDRLSMLTVTDKKYLEDVSSELLVTLQNKGVERIPKTTVYVVLYDQFSNAVGFSKTIVDAIEPGAFAVAAYTWNVNRNGAVVSIEVLPVAE